MLANIQGLPETTPQRGRKLSRIELLGEALIAADKASDAYEEEFGIDAHASDYADDYCAETDAIFEALTCQKPKTLREVAIMLRALDHHLDFLIIGTAEAESQDAREARGEKALRILKAIRAALPSPEDVGAPAQELLALAA
jgi:hypothetical protein